MAYNDMNLGMVGHVTSHGVDLTAAAQKYVNFFHAHAKDLVDTQGIADAAVLRSFASVEFNPARSLLSSLLFEQTLIQTKIPFDIISDRHLNDLSKYKVLILADQDALSDEQVNTIREFVRHGGGLVATEETSLRNDWRRQRDRFGLADVFGIDRPGPAVRQIFGQGEGGLHPPCPARHDPTTGANELLPWQRALETTRELWRTGGSREMGGRRRAYCLRSGAALGNGRARSAGERQYLADPPG